MQIQRLGRLSVHKVFELENGLPLPMFFPEVTAADMARLLQWCDDPDLAEDPAASKVTLSMHSFIVELDGKNVLVDTCNGNCKQRSMDAVHMLETAYLDNMKAAGFAPEDIDIVLCTHLHFDHVGWNTQLVDGSWVPTFPNARYLFGKRDFDHWRDQEKEPVHREAFADSIQPIVDAGLAELVEVETAAPVMGTVGDGIWMEPAFGHSPGCCTVHAQADGPGAVFWGDIIHHPVQLIRPELMLIFDDDPQRAAQVRMNLLDRLADTGTVGFSAHFRGSSAGRVRRDGDAYRFEFVPG